MEDLSRKNEIDYIKKLPEKRIAASVLIFNEFGELLIIKNSYRDYWTIPGGVVEKHESPWEGAVREAKEEIGLDVETDKLLVVDSSSSWRGDNKEYHDEVVVMIFSTKPLTNNDLKKLQMDNHEVIDHKFVQIKELGKYLNDRWINRIGDIGSSDKVKLISSNW